VLSAKCQVPSAKCQVLSAEPVALSGSPRLAPRERQCLRHLRHSEPAAMRLARTTPCRLHRRRACGPSPGTGEGLRSQAQGEGGRGRVTYSGLESNPHLALGTRH